MYKFKNKLNKYQLLKSSSTEQLIASQPILKNAVEKNV